jgi:alkylhydroperoxidase family enzyme
MHFDAQDQSEASLEKREALVIGTAPRIDPLQVSELTEDLIRIVDRMIEVNRALNSREKEILTGLVTDQAAGVASAQVSAQLANLPEIVRTMLRHPDLFAGQVDIGIVLLAKGRLTARDRELAILRIAWLCQAPYEWGEHVFVAKSLGFTSAQIERITQGSQAPGWCEHEQAIVSAVEELYDDAMISDATWATLSLCLNDQQLIELPVLVGQYQSVAYYQNCLRLRLHGGNLGLRAR